MSFKFYIVLIALSISSMNAQARIDLDAERVCSLIHTTGTTLTQFVGGNVSGNIEGTNNLRNLVTNSPNQLQKDGNTSLFWYYDLVAKDTSSKWLYSTFASNEHMSGKTSIELIPQDLFGHSVVVKIQAETNQNGDADINIEIECISL